MTNELFSLAVCNMIDKTEVFDNKITLSKQIDELITPIVKERKEDNDSNKELPRTVTEIITQKKEEINTIKQTKEDKILVMLGQMYNGVIIPEKLTCRRGEFFRYKCKSALGLDSVKDALLNNLHAVEDKITHNKNLDILEYVLNAWDKIKDGLSSPVKRTRNRYNNGYGNEDDDKTKKDLRFDEIILVENTYSHDSNTSFEILHINGVCVYDDGKVEFFYQMGKDRHKQDIQTENFNMLYLKFKTEINKLAEDFIKELDDEIKVRSDELEEIKLKGSHLLMSAELQKGVENV